MRSLEIFKKTPLYAELVNGKPIHSIMLISPDQSQLDDYAEMMCMTLFCSDTNKPCGKCNNCQKVLHHNLVDILEYPKQDEVIKSEELSQIVNGILELPYEADKKVFVLSNVSSMDMLMQNKLLKSLEEPPKDVYFILKVSNENQVLQTVKSRCRKIYLPNLSEDELDKLLPSDNVNKEEAIAFCGGSLSQAEHFLKQTDFKGNVDLIFDILLNYRNSSQTLMYSSKLYDKKNEFLDIISIYLKILQDVNYIRIGRRDLVYSSTHMDELLRICGDFSVDAILGMVSDAIKLIEKFDRNCNFNAMVDSFLLGILEVRHKCPM